MGGAISHGARHWHLVMRECYIVGISWKYLYWRNSCGVHREKGGFAYRHFFGLPCRTFQIRLIVLIRVGSFIELS